MIIHSKDDHILNYKLHFNKVKKALYLKENIEFVLVDKKRHNPNYTIKAVRLLDSYVKQRNKMLKKGLLNKDNNLEFLSQFDWHMITEQDMDVWNLVFDTLNK